MSERLRLELPFPIPLSACFKDVSFKSRKPPFRTIHTRAPTSRYEAWQKKAERMIFLQTRGMVKNAEGILLPGKVGVTVRLVAPDERARDAGNCDKSVMDALVKNGVITDDSNRYVRDLKFAWRNEGLPCVVFITPLEVEA